MNHEPEATAFTVRVDPLAALALEQLAISTERSRNWLVNRAIEEYVAQNQWQIARIEEGVRAADAGDYASDAKVKRVFGKYGKLQ